MDCSKKVFLSFEFCPSSEVMSYYNIIKYWSVTYWENTTRILFGLIFICLFINTQENASELLPSKLLFLYLGFFPFIKQL